jgi:uncharacterized protein YjhX (UPF0386 family)
MKSYKEYRIVEKLPKCGARITSWKAQEKEINKLTKEGWRIAVTDFEVFLERERLEPEEPNMPED